MTTIEKKLMNYNTYGPDDTWKRTNLVSRELIARELRRRGIRYESIGKHRITFPRSNGRQAWFRIGSVSCNAGHANMICKDKEITKAFLRAAGFSILRSEVFDATRFDMPSAFADFIGFPVVLKPLDSMGGNGVYTGIKDQTEFRKIWISKPHRWSKWMVEQHQAGVDHRFLVIDGEVAAVLRRQPPTIVGDGTSTIQTLVEARNEARDRSRNPVHKKARIDQKLISHIGRNGYGLDSILSKGEIVAIRPASNISSGGDGIDVTDDVSDAWKDLAVQIVRAIPGLVIAGVDFLIGDASAAPSPENYKIIEINHNPMLSMHHFPWMGTSRNVASLVVDRLLRGRQRKQPLADSDDVLSGPLTSVSRS